MRSVFRLPTRRLAWNGLNEEEVLLKHPELEREDLTTVQELVLTASNIETHDEIGGPSIRPKNGLVYGRYYKASEALARYECQLLRSRPRDRYSARAAISGRLASVAVFRNSGDKPRRRR